MSVCLVFLFLLHLFAFTLSVSVFVTVHLYGDPNTPKVYRTSLLLITRPQEGSIFFVVLLALKNQRMSVSHWLQLVDASLVFSSVPTRVRTIHKKTTRPIQ